MFEKIARFFNIRQSLVVQHVRKHGMRRVAPLTFLASVGLAGVFLLAQNGKNVESTASPNIRTEFVPKAGQKTTPSIEEVKAVYGVGGKILVRGSGFINPNHYQVKGFNFVEPLSSTNEREIAFRITLSVRNVQQAPFQECIPGGTCQVPLKIVNGDGVTSNAFNFPLTIPDYPLVVSYGPSPDTPLTQTTSPGTSSVEVYRALVQADAKNYDDIFVERAVAVIIPSSPVSACSDVFGLVTLSDGTKDLGGAWTYEWKTDYGWAGFPDGACIAELNLPRESYTQDNPVHVLIPPGNSKTFHLRINMQPSAPLDITFRAGLYFYFYPYYIEINSPGEWSSLVGNLVTIR